MAKWRDLGRPEAALIGVQYRANDRGGHRAPWLVRDAPARRWLFANVPLRRGREFSAGNVEIDAVAPSSPLAVEVPAEIPDPMGPELTAQMTTTRRRLGQRCSPPAHSALHAICTRRPYGGCSGISGGG